jgi:hypothetical protein
MLWYEAPMTPKYLATLAVAVLLVTFLFSNLQFATRSQVLAGKTVDETLQFEFTIDADSTRTYKITPRMAQFLKDHISFPTDGPVRVVSAKVEVTPKKVSWSEHRTRITSTGAALAVQLQWETPNDSANGAHSNIYLNFPEIPNFEGKTPTFHSGGYQRDDQDRYVVREVTTYRSTLLLSVARAIFALSAGLPLGILLHAICWAFVLKGEKRARITALPIQGSGWPQTFYPDPIAEWTIWLVVLGIFAFVSAMMAGFSVADGFMSSSFELVVYWILGIGMACALTASYFVRKYLLTVRVDSSSISYARGRGDLQWITAAWSEVARFAEKSRTYRGNTTYWIELEFKDKRKRLKITPSIQGYPALRSILRNVFQG